jgi:hypothetical protein
MNQASISPLAAAALAASVWIFQSNFCAAQPDAVTPAATEAGASYLLRKASATDSQLELWPEPILRWTNPVPEKQMHGDVFLWTDEGRPAAVLNVFEMTENGLLEKCHEFCSLANEPLLATGPKNRRWSPAASDVKMSPLSSAPAPATTPRQRLSQMRELAAQFVCQKTDRKQATHTLRLLSQPIARYESKKFGVIDGGLFTFVEATDPEAFLLLEVRPAGDNLQWHFGLARMASVKMDASFHDKLVWQVDTLPFVDYRNRGDRPYALLIFY